MAFIYERKPHYRVYDPERNLELGQGLGAHSSHSSFFHPVGKPDEKLGGFKWYEKNERVSDEDRHLFPEKVKWITTLYVAAPVVSYGSLPISGFDLRESIDIIKEALIANAKLARGKYAEESYYYKVELSETLSMLVGGA